MKVEDFTPETKVLSQAGMPTLLCRWRASIECGCAVWVGIRADNQEAATGAVPCRGMHSPLIARYNTLMTASLHTPTPRPLIDVVAEILEQARSEFAAEATR